MSDYVKTIREKIGYDLLLLVGGGVTLYRDGEVLLQRRSDNGMWSISGGGSLELGETPEEAARRELFEETGIVAGELEFVGVFSGNDHYHTYPNGDQVYVVCVEYACSDFSGEPRIDESEVADLKWFRLGALPHDEQINVIDRRIIHAICEKYA